MTAEEFKKHCNDNRRKLGYTWSYVADQWDIKNSTLSAKFTKGPEAFNRLQIKWLMDKKFITGEIIDIIKRERNI